MFYLTNIFYSAMIILVFCGKRVKFMQAQVMTKYIAYAEVLLLVCLPTDIWGTWIGMAQASHLRHFCVCGGCDGKILKIKKRES